jgi:hypothetical protein
VRIDWSDPADEHGDAQAPDDPGAAGKDRGTAVSGDDPSDSSPARPDSALLTERTVAYQAVVDAANRQYTTDRTYARPEKLESETGTQAMCCIEAEDRLQGKGQLAEAPDLKKGEVPQAPDDTTGTAWHGLGVADHGGWAWDYGGDIPDDPRNYSNSKTGRFDASWSTYDRAIAAAREHTGGDLGPDSIKMYDYHRETREGTGTLIGEQTPDRLRGWRIDNQDGHVNWWDWTGGKKGAGGAYGHDWFPEDSSTPGSRYIGWAPWQDGDGNIVEGN